MSEQDPNARRIEIHGDGIALKELWLEDAQRYFDLIEYDRQHLSQVHNGDRDETADNYQTVEDVVDSILYPKNAEKMRFGIWVNGVMVGSNNLRPLGDGRVESGSWIGKEFTGHHYAAKARALLIELAFNQLGFSEIVSDISVGNDASRKSVKKSGFRLQRIVQKIGQDGIAHDHWRYVLKNKG